MKTKRGLAYLLSFLLLFSLMMSQGTLLVRAEDPQEGGQSQERTFSVDFGSGSWTIKDVTVTANYKGTQSISKDMEITLSNFNAETMEARLTGADNFSVTLNVSDGKTSLSKRNSQGGIPDGNLTFEVVAKSDSGDNSGAGTEENTREISVTITDTEKCLDKTGDYIKIDGISVKNNCVSVKPVAPGASRKIRMLPQYGTAITVTINGKPVTGESSDGWMEYTIADADSYTIVVNKAGSSAYTVTWTYDSSLGDDALVTNGTVKIISAATADQENGIGGVNEQNEKKGLVEIKPGSKVTVEIKPDYGYQFLAGLLNGQTITPQNTISQFTFIMPETNLHLSALFTKKADSVNTTSSRISSGEIANGQRAIDSGNLKLTIKDTEAAVTDVEAMEKKAGEADIQLYLDMELSQVVNKGNENEVWENPLTDLAGNVSVTLDLPEKLKKESGTFYVIREHSENNGTKSYEKIKASHDKDKGTITFDTNKFSTYALAYDAATPDEQGGNAGTSDSGKADKNTSGSSNNSGSTTAVAAQTSAVSTAKAPVVVQEQMNGQGQLVVDIAASPKHAQLSKELLQKYAGQDVDLMIHLGNGVGVSANLSDGIFAEKVDFSADFQELPNFAQAFTTYYMKPLQQQKLQNKIGIHLHVGETYAGHLAYIFVLDSSTGVYRIYDAATINAIGNVMLETQEFTDVMVLIAK